MSARGLFFFVVGALVAGTFVYVGVHPDASLALLTVVLGAAHAVPLAPDALLQLLDAAGAQPAPPALDLVSGRGFWICVTAAFFGSWLVFHGAIAPFAESLGKRLAWRPGPVGVTCYALVLLAYVG